jgi:hypothetical protein
MEECGNHYKMVMFGKAKLFARNCSSEQRQSLPLFSAILSVSYIQIAWRVRP